MVSINYSFSRKYLLIIYFSLISEIYMTCYPEVYSPGYPEVSSLKCLYDYIQSRWYPDEPKSKELELVRKRPATESGICPANRKIYNPSDPICEKRNKEVTTAGYKISNEDEKKKRIISSFTSTERKKQDNSASEAQKKRYTSFDSYVNWKPAEGNWTTYGLHLEIPVTDKTFLQLFAIEIALILILLFSLRYYILEMKSLKNSVSEIMSRAQATAYSIAEEDVRSSSRRYPEINEETESISRNDDLSFLTSSSMVHSHLQNLVNEIKRSKPEENLEKYLTEEFLQLIADRIAQEGFMRSNFQNLLTAESLFRLGQVYYYQRNKNSGNSNLRDVKVNIGVQVGGQEIPLPKSKPEKREDVSH